MGGHVLPVHTNGAATIITVSCRILLSLMDYTITEGSLMVPLISPEQHITTHIYMF